MAEQDEQDGDGAPTIEAGQVFPLAVNALAEESREVHKHISCSMPDGLSSGEPSQVRDWASWNQSIACFGAGKPRSPLEMENL